MQAFFGPYPQVLCPLYFCKQSRLWQSLQQGDRSIAISTLPLPRIPYRVQDCAQIPKPRQRMRVSQACILVFAHVCIDRYKRAHTRRQQIKLCKNRHRLFCLRILRCFSSCFLSACRPILAVVRTQQHISNVLVRLPKPASYKL